MNKKEIAEKLLDRMTSEVDSRKNQIESSIQEYASSTEILGKLDETFDICDVSHGMVYLTAIDGPEAHKDILHRLRLRFQNYKLNYYYYSNVHNALACIYKVEGLGSIAIYRKDVDEALFGLSKGQCVIVKEEKVESVSRTETSVVCNAGNIHRTNK